MNDLLPLSERLKQRRIDLGLSQAEIASRAGLEQSQVSKLERGLDVRLSTLTKLLRALDLDLDLVPRARPGQAARSVEATPIPDPYERPTGASYPIPGTNERFVPGTLLDLFGIPDEDETPDRPAKDRSRRKR